MLLCDSGNGYYDFHLSHFIYGVDVVYTLAFILVPLMDGIDTNIPGLVVGLRFPSLANRGFFRDRFGECAPLALLGFRRP